MGALPLLTLLFPYQPTDSEYGPLMPEKIDYGWDSS